MPTPGKRCRTSETTAPSVWAWCHHWYRRVPATLRRPRGQPPSSRNAYAAPRHNRQKKCSASKNTLRPRWHKKATLSRIMRKFSSSEQRRTSCTCSKEHLPKREMFFAPQESSTWSPPLRSGHAPPVAWCAKSNQCCALQLSQSSALFKKRSILGIGRRITRFNQRDS